MCGLLRVFCRTMCFFRSYAHNYIIYVQTRKSEVSLYFEFCRAMFLYRCCIHYIFFYLGIGIKHIISCLCRCIICRVMCFCRTNIHNNFVYVLAIKSCKVCLKLCILYTTRNFCRSYICNYTVYVLGVGKNCKLSLIICIVEVCRSLWVF